VEAKIAAVAAAAAGPDAVGTAAALELLREVAAAHAFTAAQVRRLLKEVPWPAAAAAEDAAVTLFTRTVDPETGFNAALRSLPAASQMRVGQRLGCLNVCNLSDPGLNYRQGLVNDAHHVILHHSHC
jgi:membrane-bound lytic murein transglycosylase B